MLKNAWNSNFNKKFTKTNLYKVSSLSNHLNTFHANALILYLLKISEKPKVFKGYIKRPVRWNGLNRFTLKKIIKILCLNFKLLVDISKNQGSRIILNTFWDHEVRSVFPIKLSTFSKITILQHFSHNFC